MLPNCHWIQGMVYKSDISFYVQYKTPIPSTAWEDFVLKWKYHFSYIYISHISARRTKYARKKERYRPARRLVNDRWKGETLVASGRFLGEGLTRWTRGHAPSHPSRFIDRIAETQVTIVVGSATRGRGCRAMYVENMECACTALRVSI